MADKTDKPQAEQSPDTEHMLPIQIHRQYIRDFSFESPTAPDSLALQETPEMSIEVNVSAREIQDKNIPLLYEVVLSLRITTTISDTTVFLVEIDYATLASISKDVPESKHHPILFIEVPRFTFPYANQVITNICLQGGFPPLYLRPIDFHSLYLERFKGEIEEAEKTAVADGEEASS